MDFNEIKNTWQDSFNEKEKLSSNQIEAKLRLKKRSNTAIEKIKSSFKMELITGSLLYLFIITGLLSLMKMPEALIFFFLVTLMMGFPLYFYYRNYKKIKHTSYSESTLKQTLIKTTNDIEEFVNIGKGYLLKLTMIPAATTIGMFMGLFIGTGESNILEIFSMLETRSIVKMIVILILMSALLIPLSRRWFKRKFKNHFDELKECLNELNDSINK